MTVVSLILMGIAMVISAIAIFGFYRFNGFYMRILISANVDTVALLILMVGVMLQSPSPAFTLKVVLICGLALITNPLSSHATARSAYASGYRNK